MGCHLGAWEPWCRSSPVPVMASRCHVCTESPDHWDIAWRDVLDPSVLLSPPQPLLVLARTHNTQHTMVFLKLISDFLKKIIYYNLYIFLMWHMLLHLFGYMKVKWTPSCNYHNYLNNLYKIETPQGGKERGAVSSCFIRLEHCGRKLKKTVKHVTERKKETLFLILTNTLKWKPIYYYSQLI